MVNQTWHIVKTQQKKVYFTPVLYEYVSTSLPSLKLLYLVQVNLVDGRVGGGGGDAPALRHVSGPNIADELPPPVVVTDHTLDLRVEVAVG